ncbi:MAG TPA: hypothetical protein VE967_19800 [Gemmatimonadaceae bacterium]|nr:hypothetical protein [Gemmatimonadaceae bacterium]
MFFVALVFLLAQPVCAQDRPYAFPASLATETRATLTRIADSARAANVPADLIVAKAAEGVLKGADDARIVRAARTLFGELVRVRAVLPPSAGSALLSAAASALHAGVPVPTIVRLSAAGANESELATGLVAAADLSASGVPPARAGSAIETLLKRHAPEADIAALREGVARDVAAGRAPESALGARLDGLLKKE